MTPAMGYKKQGQPIPIFTNDTVNPE